MGRGVAATALFYALRPSRSSPVFSQWMRPTGARSVWPKLVNTPGGKCANLQPGVYASIVQSALLRRATSDLRSEALVEHGVQFEDQVRLRIEFQQRLNLCSHNRRGEIFSPTTPPNLFICRLFYSIGDHTLSG
jgi:hypothetical protein